MFNFNEMYNLILEDIIQSVTPEELKERRKEYGKILLKKYFDKLFKENKMVKNVDGTYDVNSNIDISFKNLNSLEYIPYKLNKINGRFDCYSNNLTNLIGSPKIVTQRVNCSGNNLTSLEGCPEIIHDDFFCSYNNLTSLEGCPKEVKGDFVIQHMKNKFKFYEQDIREVCTIEGEVFV